MMIKVFLAEVITTPDQKDLLDQRMEELEQLVWTYGGMTVVKTVQQRAKPNYKTYVWSGKLEEIIQEMELCGASLLIFGNILKPWQIYTVNEILRKHSKDRDIELQARDRIDLILKIFDRHASSTEARLQIELASIKHMWPRIFGMGMEMSRQGWWWSGAMRWLWETNTEVMRRHLRVRRRQILSQLSKYEQVRKTHRESRQKKHLPTVWLVGYTNAWKSSLMNALTNKWVLVEDKLFATLGTDVGKVWLDYSNTIDTKSRTYTPWKEVLINDTIWFIRDLPPSLINAFKSTLEDSIESDLLLHTIDWADILRQDKVQVVDAILDDIWAIQDRTYVINKIDTIPTVTTDYQSTYISRLQDHCELSWYPEPEVIFVSAHTWDGIDELKRHLRDSITVNYESK